MNNCSMMTSYCNLGDGDEERSECEFVCDNKRNEEMICDRSASRLTMTIRESERDTS